MDINLPSNLDFDQKINDDQEKIEFNSVPKIIKQDNIYDPQIKSYNVKGKELFNIQPIYQIGQIVKGQIKTFAVKAFDE